MLSQPDLQQVAWSSDHTTTTATITPSNTRIEQRRVKIIRAADVAAPGALDAISARYSAKTTTRIHVSPDPGSPGNGTLQRGDRIWAVGHVKGAPWILVARAGKSVGYVSDAKLGPEVQPPAYASAAAAALVVARGSQAPTGTYDLDAADAVVRQPADLDTPESGDKVDVVSADVTCRDLKTSTNAGGKSDSSTQTACRAPDGAWQLD